MRKLIKTELMKIQWRSIFLLILIDVLVSSIHGTNNVHEFKNVFEPNWTTLYFQSVFFHAMFLLPLYTGIIASLVYSYEYKNRAWKQILTLPYSRPAIYLSKFIIIIVILFTIQIAFLLSYILAGYKLQLIGVIPWKTVAFGVLVGWLAAFPLAALQLWLSTKLESFARALVLNIFMVIPNIVITGFQSNIGAWFPYSSTYYAMFPQGIYSQGVYLSPRVEWNLFFLIIFATFMFYLIKGCCSFSKKDWI